ncbi:hypothetical protein [Nocardia tengchongensis]
MAGVGKGESILIAANEGSGRELRTGVAELDTPMADMRADES